jgi:hypothetical protein
MIRMRDSKLAEGWNFWDVATALRATNSPAAKLTMF